MNLFVVQAQSHEERGLVPSNFLAECPELSDSEEIEIDIGAASPSIKVCLPIHMNSPMSDYE